MEDPNLVTTVSADDLAPNGARSSAGTVLTAELNMFLTEFLRLLVNLINSSYLMTSLQNGGRDRVLR